MSAGIASFSSGRGRRASGMASLSQNRARISSITARAAFSVSREQGQRPSYIPDAKRTPGIWPDTVFTAAADIKFFPLFYILLRGLAHEVASARKNVASVSADPERSFS